MAEQVGQQSSFSCSTSIMLAKLLYVPGPASLLQSPNPFFPVLAELTRTEQGKTVALSKGSRAKAHGRVDEGHTLLCRSISSLRSCTCSGLITIKARRTIPVGFDGVKYNQWLNQEHLGNMVDDTSHYTSPGSATHISTLFQSCT